MQMPPEIDTSPPEGLDSFLSKIEEVSSMINEIKTAEDPSEILSKADRYIEADGKVGFDSTVINKTPSIGQSPPQPQQQQYPGATVIPPMASGPLPDGMSSEQAGFMAGFEQDARERAERRKKREADSLVPKNKGNAAFKRGDYRAAVALYLEATRIDPANPLLYTNAAQAYLKLGDFAAAAERCDIAIRADEKCIKGHLRLGLAKVGLGEYKEAKACFKHAKVLSPKKQHAVFDKHIEDAELAEEIASREQALLLLQAQAQAQTEGGGGTVGPAGAGAGVESAEGDALKSIERGCIKLGSSSGLSSEQFRAVCDDLSGCITGLHHQDLFRLRKGTRAMSQASVVSMLQAVSSEGSNAKAAVAMLKLLLVAIRNNEASRRDLFCVSDTELKTVFGLVAVENQSVRSKALALLAEGCDSPRVRASVAKIDREGEVKIFQALNKMIVAGSASMVAVFELAAKMALDQGYHDSVKTDFATNIYPSLEQCITQGGAVGSAAMKYLIQLSAGPEMRALLAEPAMVPLLQAVLPALIQQSRDSTDNTVTLCNFLGLLTNIALHPTAAAVFRAPMFTAFLAELFGLSSVVQVRAATLIGRLCTDEAYVDSLISSTLFGTLAGLKPLGEYQAQYADVFARIAIKSCKASNTAREWCIDNDVMAFFLPLLRGEHGNLIGNVALGISELTTSKAVCAKLIDSTVVADLMTHARKDKSQITENCAVALARLAAGDPAHLARIKQLGGLEVMHSRSNLPAR